MVIGVRGERIKANSQKHCPEQALINEKTCGTVIKPLTESHLATHQIIASFTSSMTLTLKQTHEQHINILSKL